MRDRLSSAIAGRALCVTGALVLLGGAAAAARAQARPTAGTLTGVVHDSAGTPISDVEITATKQVTTVRSDSVGRFTLSAIPVGSIELSFRRLAFAPVVVTIEIPATDTTDIEVTLTVVAQKLNGVVVQAHAPKRRVLEAFESRRRAGIGYFVTRAQIEQRHPYQLSDMLRRIPGLNVIPGFNGRMTLRFARVGGSNCSPQYFLDGIQATGFTIDEVPPGDVEGVELYGGASGVPPEYNRLNGTSNCGTVLIWTRIPGNGAA